MRGKRGRSWWTELGILPFNFCWRVYTLCLFGMSVSFRMCLCVCEKFQRDGSASFWRNLGLRIFNELMSLNCFDVPS